MHAVLAAQSHFSIGDSTLTVERLVETAKAAGAEAVALTDVMSITGMIDFTNRAKKVGIKPIIGCRLTLLDHKDLAWRKTRDDKKAPREYRLTAYVLSEAGLKCLFRLLTLANSEERFYHHPRLSFDDLLAELESLPADSLAVASGDAYSAIAHADALALWNRLIAAVGASNAFLTLAPIDTPYWDAMNALAVSIGNQIGPAAQFLVTRPAQYGPDGADAAEIMGAVCNNRRLTDGWHPRNVVRDFEPRALNQLVTETVAAAKRLEERRGLKAGFAFKDGLQRTAQLVERVGFIWDKAPVSLPQMAPDEFAAVVEACKAGWRQRFTSTVFGDRPDMSNPDTLKTYKDRLSYELSVLKKLNFSGYFLLVQDVVAWAKSQGILVGPGRGSVGGSLVAYLMGITECDPIRFELLFERFINPERLDLPDADLDFMSERRGEVIDYLIGRYGKARVAGISNFGTLGPASAIRDVGKAFDMSEDQVSCSKVAPKLHGANVPLPKAAELAPEIGRFRDLYPPVWKHCVSLEGVMRNLGRHAAGVVVGGCDLVERAVVERRKDGATVNWDKRIVEDQGLVKMDILGLSTLDLIDLACQYVKERTGRTLDLLSIPLDDPHVLDNFAKGVTTGVFQFEGGGMKRLLKNLGKDGVISFEDITAATALYRPGPMESGMMDSYWRRKAGEETIEYDHPLMEPILKPTYGVIVYQEQVMKISQAIAGYTGAQADKLRKIMGKKLPEEMKKERKNFVDGCVATIKCEEEWAGKLFDKIEGFAGYGFNRSHSVEYSLISYQSMYLKQHHTVEFFAAALSLMDAKKLPAVLKDAEKCGIEVTMPDINLSTDRIEILTDTMLCIPFKAIKGISANSSGAIMQARKAVGQFTSRAHFEATLTALKIKGKCNVRHIDNLDKVGAFARLDPGQLPANHPDRIRDQRELIPGLVSAIVPINRDMHADKDTFKALIDLVADYLAKMGPKGKNEMAEFGADAAGVPVKPLHSRIQKAMVIFDAPSTAEERQGKIGMGDNFAWEVTEQAIEDAGLSVKDFYFTSLIKTPKAGKQLSGLEISTWAPVLEQEIALLQPPAIVLLGSGVVRHFLPDFKGKASEVAGEVVYRKDLDANLVIGFNPGECYFDGSKTEGLVAAFEMAGTIFS